MARETCGMLAKRMVLTTDHTCAALEVGAKLGEQPGKRPNRSLEELGRSDLKGRRRQRQKEGGKKWRREAATAAGAAGTAGAPATAGTAAPIHRPRCKKCTPLQFARSPTFTSTPTSEMPQGVAMTLERFLSTVVPVVSLGVTVLAACFLHGMFSVAQGALSVPGTPQTTWVASPRCRNVGRHEDIAHWMESLCY